MSVEFLPDEDGPVEEELPDRPRPNRRWWLLAAAVVVAAVAVGVVVRAGSDDPSPTAAKTPTASRSIDHPLGTADPSDRADRACRGAPFCQARLAVPPALRTVLHRYLPAPISSLQVTTYVGQTLTSRALYLAERDIKVTIGSVSVLVVVSLQLGSTTPAPSVIVTAPPGVGSVLVHASRPEYVIDLQYLAPETVPPNLPKLGQLTKDPVLEAL